MLSPSSFSSSTSRSVVARKGKLASLVALYLASAALVSLPVVDAFTTAASPSSSYANRQIRCCNTALSLLPSQASELVQAASVQLSHPDDEDEDDTNKSNNEAAADASWLWDFHDDSGDSGKASDGTASTPAANGVARGLVARVFALPSSLIKRKRDPHIAVTKDDVVLFPVVGCRLVPEYSYREDVSDDDDDADRVHEHRHQTQHGSDNNQDAAISPRRKKVVHVRSLPTVSNPSCRIRNFRDEEVVGWWYRKSGLQQQQEGEDHSSSS
jgi:hypothetical protein